MRQLFLAAGVWLGLAVPALRGAEIKPADADFFEKKIRPVLVAECYTCHSAQAKKIKGGLLLDSRDGLLKGGEQGPILSSTKPESSTLLRALRYADKDLKMPPDHRLSDSVIADFAEWVRRGAPDPRTGPASPSPSPEKTIDLASARQFWSFQSVRPQTPPAVKATDWPAGNVDRFVLARLESAGLHPAADAEPATLIRRVWFDLVGLPPPPADVEAFVRDPSPAALAAIVDRLLASRQYGERWGRHWLDVARFGESNGNTDNFLFPHAWRYRNYVIDAYAADLPLDQFLQQQIAGDLLPAASPQERDRNLIATGFLALASKPRKQNNPDFEMDIVSDQIEVATTAVMGLTVECARCHDHKFDPVTMKDYYALAGIFTSTQTLYSQTGGEGKNGKKAAEASGLNPILGNQPAPPQSAQLAELDQRIAALRTELAPLVAAVREAKKAGPAVSGDPSSSKPSADAKNPTKPEQALSEKQTLKQQARLAKGNLPDSPRLKQLRDELQQLEGQRDKLRAAMPAPAGVAMGARDGRPADCALCLRGESAKRGPVVPRGFVSVVNYSPDLKIHPAHSGRLELAQWLTRPENPLTARVYANRVWLHLFGAGLVRTPDNFGALGEKPTHPELLDYLAGRLVEQGWSTRRLIKELVLSRAYRMGGAFDSKCHEVDPENRLLWRQAPRRLDAEAIRDAILSVSGQLDPSPLLGSAIEARGEQEVRGPAGEEIARLESLRRSVYLPAVRNASPEALATFDAADSSLIVGARSSTNVPTQALFLLNSPFVRSKSKAAAEKLLAAPEDDERLIDRAWLAAFARKPTAQQRDRVRNYLNETAAGRPTAQSAAEKRLFAWTNVFQALFTAAEFRYLN